jgi:Flp pilus assembly protein TadG
MVGRRARNCSGEGERGQSLVWFAMLLPALLAILGLVVDAGLALEARRDLQNVADRAARAGAMQIDESSLLNGVGVRLDPARATEAAGQYAAGAGVSVTGLAVGTDEVAVRVGRSFPSTFLRLFGVGGITMTATGSARPRVGY